MAEQYIPEGTPNAPGSISLLTILKAFNPETGQEFPTRFTNVNTLLSDTIAPLFENIQGDPYTNEELGEILTELSKQVLLNSREILYLKHLIALLTFRCEEQGLKIGDKELLQNLETYLKYK
jgi:hypothetical protein